VWEVWEIRVVVGFDPVRGRSVQRSFTVHSDAEFAQRRRQELVADYGVLRINSTVAGAQLKVGELLAEVGPGTVELVSGGPQPWPCVDAG
jgi:hypothetical protein